MYVAWDSHLLRQTNGCLQKLHPAISGVIAKAASVNSAIGARASATIHTSQDLAHALLEQLRQITEHGVQLPSALFEVSTSKKPNLRVICAHTKIGCFKGQQ